MGQYHTIYNKTKKEYFSIGGATLLEKSFNPLCSTALMLLLCNSNGRGGGDLYIEREYTKTYKAKPLKGEKLALQEALDKIQGRWAGDEIVIQGDYAKETDPSYLTEDSQKDYKNINKELLEALEADEELASMVKNERRFCRL